MAGWGQGDAVRVVYEGVVNDMLGRFFTVGDTDTSYPLRDATSVEVIEQRWLPGDVVRDGRGNHYLRVEGYRAFETDYPWLKDGRPGEGQPDDLLLRPLTLVIRNGRVVDD